MKLRFLILISFWAAGSVRAQPLHDTKPLLTDDDLAERMVAGIDVFLLDKLANAYEGRLDQWGRVLKPGKHPELINRKRERLATILGVKDDRHAFNRFQTEGAIYRSPADIDDIDT